jgi:hypothetical protein
VKDLYDGRLRDTAAALLVTLITVFFYLIVAIVGVLSSALSCTLGIAAFTSKLTLPSSA